MVSGPQWLVHLSDIHFSKPDLGRYDLDQDLRDQLELDVARVRETIRAPMAGILVTGDIAWGGAEEEYKRAFAWLKNLAEIAGCIPDAVWCVPGNHDVDRSLYDKSLQLRNLHKNLRPDDSRRVDACIKEILDDVSAADSLFSSVEKYNRFAGKFGCSTKPGQLFWSDTLELNDGSSLRLHGANSTLASNKLDKITTHKLVLGTLQATPSEKSGEAVVFLCHHPPDWLLDRDLIESGLNARTRVQLFGHKHAPMVNQIDQTLRVIAGAVHPDRDEPRWKPRYNILGFSVSGTDSKRELCVDLYPRTWGESSPKFVPDTDQCEGEIHRLYKLPLGKWVAPPLSGRGPSAACATGVPKSGADTTTAMAASGMDPAKLLTYRFLSLPHLVRLEIAQKLQLLREEDEGLFDSQILDRMFARAAKRGVLDKLWAEVASRNTEMDSIPNPYARP